MTNWRDLARAVDPPVPETAAEAVAPLLEALESSVQPLLDSVPIDTLPWTKPEDLS